MYCTGCGTVLVDGTNWKQGVLCEGCLKRGAVHNGMSGPYSQTKAKYCVRCGRIVPVGLVEHTDRCPHSRELRG